MAYNPSPGSNSANISPIKLLRDDFVVTTEIKRTILLKYAIVENAINSSLFWELETFIHHIVQKIP